ncbi:MAG: transcription termination/antitermination NusG family protein [Verrucomicrobiota bacterium]
MDETSRHWFCIRSRPKQEHIAAAYLRQWEDVEVFCPRIRFRRATRSGAAWVTEALFPGYFFARFEPRASLCLVRSGRGVSGIVRFGTKYPLVAEATIAQLRESVGREEMETVSPVLEIGDGAMIAGGAFHGLQCVVHRLLPARQRVAVLLEMLGQTMLVELNLRDLLPPRNHPLAA